MLARQSRFRQDDVNNSFLMLQSVLALSKWQNDRYSRPCLLTSPVEGKDQVGDQGHFRTHVPLVQ